MNLLHSGYKDYPIQVASLTAATACTFAGMNSLTRVLQQLSVWSLMKNWLLFGACAEFNQQGKETH